jgi:hypothetical protein
MILNPSYPEDMEENPTKYFEELVQGKEYTTKLPKI